MKNTIPVLETERLILRAHTIEDFPDMLRLWQDPIATQYLPPGPLNREACWTIWLQYRGLWAGLGFGYWAIKEKASGAYIGDAGFADFHRDTTPPMPVMHEIGYILHPDYHARGYGYEAQCAMLAWQAQHFHRPVCCLILPENVVSLKLAKKSGFLFDDKIVYQGHQLWLGIRPSGANSR